MSYKPRNPLYRHIETGKTIRASEWGLKLHLMGWQEAKESGCINSDSSDFERPRKMPLEEQIAWGVKDLSNMPDEWELVDN